MTQQAGKERQRAPRRMAGTFRTRLEITNRSGWLTREYRLVLIPAYGLLLIIVGQLAVTSAFWWLGLHNVACLYAATAIAYAVSYEWLHFSYHLPHEHPVARNPIIQRLARHHAVHHDPRIMQRWNMNVTVPLTDHVMGTAVQSVAEAEARRRHT